MSHASDFRLVVLDKTKIPTYFGNYLASTFLGRENLIPSAPNENAEVSIRTMRGSTESDFFKDKIERLLKVAALDSLLFLTETACTHLETDSLYDEDDEDEEWDEDDLEDSVVARFYTVIKPEKLDRLLADMERLFSWCSHNLEAASEALGSKGYGNDVKEAMENAFVCENLNQEAPYGEDGDSWEFFFCALKSIQDLLMYAKSNNLYAIYENENCGLGLQSLRKYPPQIIVD